MCYGLQIIYQEIAKVRTVDGGQHLSGISEIGKVLQINDFFIYHTNRVTKSEKSIFAQNIFTYRVVDVTLWKRTNESRVSEM